MKVLLKLFHESHLDPSLCSGQAQTPWGREIRLGVACPMPWGAVPPAQTKAARAPAPAWQDWALHRFVPGDVQFRPFSTVTTNCYQNVSWQLGSDCCLGSSATCRNSRNGTVLYALLTDFSQNRIVRDKAGIGSAKYKNVLILFMLVPPGLTPDCAGPGRDLNGSSGLEERCERSSCQICS